MGRYNTLAGSLPQLSLAYQLLEQLAAKVGVSFQINDFGGFRTPAITALILQYRQQDYAAAIAAGEISPGETVDTFRPIAPYGQSWHDYGAAFDVSPIAWPASESYDWAVAQLGALAPAAGLVWPLPSTDPAHFQLPISLDEAAADYAAFAGGSGSPVAGLPPAGSVAGVLVVVLMLAGVAWVLSSREGRGGWNE